MNVFTPYKSPIDCAKILDAKRLNKQIIECEQIIKAKHWVHHPAVLQYKNHIGWLWNYMQCLRCYHQGHLEKAKEYSDEADKFTPSFVDDAWCENMRRRLYTKNPQWYEKFFGELEPTQENWYFVDGELRKYIKGKRIK